MHHHVVPQLPVPHRYPGGFWRMSDYTSHHVVVSRQLATAAIGERLIAELTAHNNDGDMVRRFQRMLRVTLDDWQRTDATTRDTKVTRR